MDIDVVVTRKAVWWAWGDGGHRIVKHPGGDYPDKRLPLVPGQLNNPQPHECDFTHQLLEMPKDFTGWVTKTHAFCQSRSQKQQGLPPGLYDTTYWFLRRLKGNRIELDAQEVHRMRCARKDFLGLTDKEDDETRVPLLISEIAFYDEDMKFISSFNPFMPLSVGMSMELIIDTRTAAEKLASDAAWERSENERAARGAMM